MFAIIAAKSETIACLANGSRETCSDKMRNSSSASTLRSAKERRGFVGFPVSESFGFIRRRNAASSILNSFANPLMDSPPIK